MFFLFSYDDVGNIIMASHCYPYCMHNSDGRIKIKSNKIGSVGVCVQYRRFRNTSACRMVGIGTKLSNETGSHRHTAYRHADIQTYRRTNETANL